MTCYLRKVFQFLGFASILSSCQLLRTTAFLSIYPPIHHDSHSSLKSSSLLLSSPNTITSEEIRSRLVKQLEKLREKDRHAKALEGEVRERTKKGGGKTTHPIRRQVVVLRYS